MQDQTPSPASLFEFSHAGVIDRRDDAHFQYEIEKLIKSAEDSRLHYMNKHQVRQNIAASISMFIILSGASGFAWFLLMEAELTRAIASLLIAFTIPFLLNGWTKGPLTEYIKDHRSRYLPELGKLMGGFSYHSERGIAENVISKTGIAPNYDRYYNEDCFRGIYKGSKVMFSEAAMVDSKKQPLFRGLLALIELPHTIFEGHTIITADRAMAEQYARTRWGKLSPVPLAFSGGKMNRFVAYSDEPQAAALVLGENFIKELAEVDIAFGNANMSAVLFRGKYIFLMIPHEADMFEAFDLYIPVSTRKHALACKKEIDQLLEMIDVIHLYRTQS
jgi:hypothetical protein